MGVGVGVDKNLSYWVEWQNILRPDSPLLYSFYSFRYINVL